MKGGCACGAIRYRFDSEPFDTSWCHCRNCQKISDAPAAVYTMLARDGFVIEEGKKHLGSVKLTDFAERVFCMKCGSPLATKLVEQPSTIDVTVASLDDPSLLPPEFHIFCQSKIRWMTIEDGLPRYPRNRRDGTQVPQA
ncbi:MAG: GFA family protein [Pseudomonadota bacterium]